MFHRLTLRCHLQEQFPARLGFAVQRLCNRSRATQLAEKQDLHLKVASVVCHSQHVSNPNLTRSFGGLSIGLNPTEFTSSCGQCSRLEESGSPKPLVHAHEGHDLFSHANGSSLGQSLVQIPSRSQSTAET